MAQKDSVGPAVSDDKDVSPVFVEDVQEGRDYSPLQLAEALAPRKGIADEIALSLSLLSWDRAVEPLRG